MHEVDQGVEVVTVTVITRMMIIQTTVMISTQMTHVEETDTAVKLIPLIDLMVSIEKMLRLSF